LFQLELALGHLGHDGKHHVVAAGTTVRIEQSSGRRVDAAAVFTIAVACNIVVAIAIAVSINVAAAATTFVIIIVGCLFLLRRNLRR
jgi:formate/nitrite transporter FocA (FNT family)